MDFFYKFWHLHREANYNINSSIVLASLCNFPAASKRVFILHTAWNDEDWNTEADVCS